MGEIYYVTPENDTLHYSWSTIIISQFKAGGQGPSLIEKGQILIKIKIIFKSKN